MTKEQAEQLRTAISRVCGELEQGKIDPLLPASLKELVEGYIQQSEQNFELAEAVDKANKRLEALHKRLGASNKRLEAVIKRITAKP